MAIEENESPATGGGKKKIILIIVIALVVLVGGGVAAFLLLKTEQPAQSAETQAVVSEPQNVEAIYVSLPQPFVFNVTGDNQKRLVQVKVELLVRGAKNEQYAKDNLPLIEHSLLTTFSGATVGQLRSPQGLAEIRKQALNAIQVALQAITGVPVVERVLFTGFVMQ